MAYVENSPRGLLFSATIRELYECSGFRKYLEPEEPAICAHVVCGRNSWQGGSRLSHLHLFSPLVQVLLKLESSLRGNVHPVRSISLYEFGGSEEAVRRIQRPFVQLFRDCAPVLDIGCGRGVFLDLLSAGGVEAVGIDHSEEALLVCQQKGFQVHREDARSYLRQKSGQFGGIFCSHVIEHMGYEDAMEFLKLCHGGLRAKGVLLLITPNPDDLCIMSEIFWLDPTHVRPYPKLLLEKMLEAVGFEIRIAKHFVGSWRLVAKRKIPGYLLRRMVLGRHYGKPNTMVLAAKV